jgi:hypothetical protein
MKRFAFALAILLPPVAPAFIGVRDLPVQTLAQAGYPTGGTAFTRTCPSGSVLTGFRTRKGVIIDAIGIKCRAVGADGTLGTETSVGSLTGGDGGTASAGSCPSGTVITGSVGALAFPVGLFGFAFECRHWNAATRRWSGLPVTAINIPTVGGLVLMALPGPNLALLTGFATYRACSNETQPAEGIAGRSGTYLDAVGLRCDEP